MPTAPKGLVKDLYLGIYTKKRGAKLLLVPRFVGLRIAL